MPKAYDYKVFQHLAGLRTQRQRNIRIRTTSLGLTRSQRFHTPIPTDTVASIKRRMHSQSATRERVTVDIKQIIVQVVGQRVLEIGLRAAVVQPVLGSGDLEGDAARDIVVVRCFSVVRAGVDGLTLADGATYGPEVDGVGAGVLDDGVAGQG